MNLAPKASRGYAMAALLVALSVMAVLLSVALPAWSHMIRREKEEELIFRGLQYARAINQYQRKFANASPASLDLLIEQRLLRKKFKDPLSPNKDGEFQLLYVSQGTGPGPIGVGNPAARGSGSAVGGGGAAATLGTKPSGGIAGVASKNTGTSLRTYNQKTKYNEWQFVGMEQGAAGAVGGAGAGPAGGRAGARGGFDGRGGGPVRGPGTRTGFPGGGGTGSGSGGPGGRGSGRP
jgi:type II secretory pathway pseudopilin PulG